MKRPRLSGFEKFAVSLGVVLCVIVSFAGIVAILWSALIFSSPTAAQKTTAPLYLAGSIVLAIGAGYGAYALNSLLPAIRKGPPQNPFVCSSCGFEAPVVKARLMRHIGMIVAFQSADMRGYFCKECFMDVFWRYTLVTFFFGWWGMISICLTPIVLLNNLILLIRSFRLTKRAPDATKPTLLEKHIQLMGKLKDRLRERLAAGEDEELLSRDLSTTNGLTPAQAFMIVSTVASGRERLVSGV